MGRAPHKPLLLLYALGRFQREGARPIEFSALENDLNELLREFGPPRKTSAGYPFHHLTNDDLLWEVRTADGGSSPGPDLGPLRALHARGRLHPRLVAALDADSALLPRLVRALLDADFAPSMHADICQMVGLDLEDAELPSGMPGRRDPAFRLEVLEAYEYCCAFCGYDGWLNGVAVGLDAAHVRWRTYGGPDQLGNGICLCALHHRLFDRGVVGLSEDGPSPFRASTSGGPRRPGVSCSTLPGGRRGSRNEGWSRSGRSTSGGMRGRCSGARPRGLIGSCCPEQGHFTAFHAEVRLRPGWFGVQAGLVAGTSGSGVAQVTGAGYRAAK